MQLSEALRVQKGEVVSLVGAGGKTTAMYRLGSELASQGWRVLVTTTTMIRPPSHTQAGRLIVESSPEAALCSVREALRPGSVTALVSQRLEAEGKLKGVSVELAARLAALADVVILEADGARGLSLKAPAHYEPVVPPETTVVVPVVGIDAVGRSLGRGIAHRPELVSELTGVPQGTTITTTMVARLLVHREGGLKGVPAGCRVQPLINKVEDASGPPSGRCDQRTSGSDPRAPWRSGQG
jgi:molybdenum cofactor cytidylyltransferase